MDSIDLVFKVPEDFVTEGLLLYQITYDNKIQQIDSGFRIYSHEWDEERGTLVFPDKENLRHEYLVSIYNDLEWEMRRFRLIIEHLKRNQHGIDDIVKLFQGYTAEGKGVFDFMRRVAARLYRLRRTRCGETMTTSLPMSETSMPISLPIQVRN